MGVYDNHRYPWLNTHGLNLDWVIKTVQENAELVSGVDDRIKNKLDIDGDLIGTWKGETKESVDGKINDGLSLSQEVIELINSDTSILNIYDGWRFEDTSQPTFSLDGGLFNDTTPPDYDVDGGHW